MHSTLKQGCAFLEGFSSAKPSRVRSKITKYGAQLSRIALNMVVSI